MGSSHKRRHGIESALVTQDRPSDLLGALPGFLAWPAQPRGAHHGFRFPFRLVPSVGQATCTDITSLTLMEDQPWVCAVIKC